MINHKEGMRHELIYNYGISILLKKGVLQNPREALKNGLLLSGICLNMFAANPLPVIAVAMISRLERVLG